MILRADWSVEMLAIIRAESFVFQFAIQNLKITIYRTTILPVVFMGVKFGSSH
jgi:hypothetical protein